MFGHCTLSEYEIEKLPNEVKRKFENMCEMKAVNSMLPLDMFGCEIEGKILIDAYSSLLTSLFIYFKILEEGEIEKMGEILKSIKKLKEEKKLVYKSVTSPLRNHPFVTFRFDNMCSVIDMHLKKMHISDQVISEIYDQSIKFINYFGFKECLHINPYYRKNKKSQMKNLDISYDVMKTKVHKDYLL